MTNLQCSKSGTIYNGYFHVIFPRFLLLSFTFYLFHTRYNGMLKAKKSSMIPESEFHLKEKVHKR